MSQTDNTNDTPRRYRAEVKRAKIVRKRDSSSDGHPPLAEKDETELIQTEAPAEQEKEPAAASAPEAVQQEDAPEAPDALKTDPVKAENDSVKDSDADDLEMIGYSDPKEYVDKTRVLPNEEFEYVIPKESFKQHYSRKHVASEHKGNTKTATEEERKEADSGYIFSRRRHRKHRRHHHHHHHKFRRLALWKRILIIATAIILALVLIFSGTFLILREIGRRNMHNYDNFEVTTPNEDEKGNEIIKVDNRGRVITYKGVSYQLNEDIISVTFIGADEGTGDNADLQMADAIYIMALDTETGKMKILGISRDTMADVDLYSEQGKFIDTRRMQMSFAYAYGSDTVTGGKNTTTALSRLFYSLPLDDYFAINMKALITLNDTIGGVTLTSSMTFTSPIDGRTITEGETVTLHGKEADYYVRHRNSEKLDSNSERMARQQEYIRAFMSSIIPAAKKDISVVSKLYDEIKVNSDSTLNLPKITYIASTAASKVKNASDIEYVSLKGTISEGEFAELNVTNEETMETMLDVFYTPLAEVPDTTE